MSIYLMMRSFMMKNRIRIFRREKNLTQAEFAKLLDITSYRFRSLESGRALPSQGLAMKIAEMLGVSIDQVFFIEENPG
ncbi:helix-turn-helix transcriptional regulator [Pedobacter caeni]|uniref:Putative transcriptional regulator n=1 Tax=Pedobacter caeni TaxID=288992 RepID=A0A1M4W4H3_9SPHI|nr:helix-turn-helix transcriptional regulator [Pedobacter caeni]SHE76119.1 putative transcriptional regulator [Pedobacter caeni]